MGRSSSIEPCAKIAIATVTDRAYLPAACCQLKSTADFLPDKNAADLFMVCCDVGDEDIGEARQFFARRGIDVTIIVPKELVARIRPINKRWPRAAYLRLYFDAIFGREYDRLIYLDADTRVCAPIAPLLKADLHRNPVGAVHDFIYYFTDNIRRRRRALFLAEDAPYLQSGVMVFDWPATLDNGGLGRAREFLSRYPDRCQEAPDQDALNAAFEGQWAPLDPRWNLHELYLFLGRRHKPHIEHYTSRKPWSRLRPAAWRSAAKWYKRELQDTAWANFVLPQSAFDELYARLAFVKFRCAPAIFRLGQTAPFILDLARIPRAPSDISPVPFAPRSRKDVEDMAQALIDEAEGRRPRIVPPESILRAQAPRAVGRTVSRQTKEQGSEACVTSNR